MIIPKYFSTAKIGSREALRRDFSYLSTMDQARKILKFPENTKLKLAAYLSRESPGKPDLRITKFGRMGPVGGPEKVVGWHPN